MASSNISAFYPELNKNYVYLTSLQNSQSEKGKNLYRSASSAISGALENFGAGDAWKTAYGNLNDLVKRERAAEQEFLSTNLKGVTLEEVKSYGFKQMIDSFNEILNYQTTYQTNIERIIAMEEGVLKNGQVDRIYSLVNYTLPGELRKYLQTILKTKEDLERFMQGDMDEQIKKETAAIIQAQIIKVYGEKGSASKEYKEFSQLMQSLLSEGEFVKRVLQGYGVSPEQLRTSYTEKSKQNALFESFQPKDLMLKRQGGNMFETFTNEVLQAVSASFKGKTLATGNLNNMKADHIIEIGIENLGEKLKKAVEGEKGQGERSIRMKNIHALKKFFADIKNIQGSIVEVSDKNYRLNSQSFAEEKGFAAETPSFENLGKVLGTAMSKNFEDVEDLVFVLANTGNLRINQQTEGLEKYLATTIGNFLFDDIVITDFLDDQVSSINRIHVFNLGGIYIPLSVFLQAAYDAFTAISVDYSDFVNVKISPGKLQYQTQEDGLESEDWTDLYQQAVTKGHVAFHFFGNFTSFIAQHIRG